MAKARLVRDVLEGKLSSADDRVHLDPGGPPQAGVMPHVRVGNRWFNTVWLVPLGAVLLVAGIVRKLVGRKAIYKKQKAAITGPPQEVRSLAPP